MLKERLLKKKKQKKSRGKYNKEYVEGVATILHTYYCDLKTWNKLSPKKKRERNGKRLKYLAEIDTGKRKYLPPGIWKKPRIDDLYKVYDGVKRRTVYRVKQHVEFYRTRVVKEFPWTKDEFVTFVTRYRDKQLPKIT